MGCLVRVRVRVRVRREACLLSFCLFARRKRGLYCIVWPEEEPRESGWAPSVPCSGLPGGLPHGRAFELARSQLVAREWRAERAVDLSAVPARRKKEPNKALRSKGAISHLTRAHAYARSWRVGVAGARSRLQRQLVRAAVEQRLRLGAGGYVPGYGSAAVGAGACVRSVG